MGEETQAIRRHIFQTKNVSSVSLWQPRSSPPPAEEREREEREQSCPPGPEDWLSFDQLKNTFSPLSSDVSFPPDQTHYNPSSSLHAHVLGAPDGTLKVVRATGRVIRLPHTHIDVTFFFCRCCSGQGPKKKSRRAGWFARTWRCIGILVGVLTPPLLYSLTQAS